MILNTISVHVDNFESMFLDEDIIQLNLNVSKEKTKFSFNISIFSIRITGILMGVIHKGMHMWMSFD